MLNFLDPPTLRLPDQRHGSRDTSMGQQGLSTLSHTCAHSIGADALPWPVQYPTEVNRILETALIGAVPTVFGAITQL